MSGHFVTGYNIGADLLKALKLEGRRIVRLTLDVCVDEPVTITTTEHMMDDQVGGLNELLSRYNLVPEEPEEDDTLVLHLGDVKDWTCEEADEIG